MRNNKKWLAAWVAGALICGNLSAQETDFDLSSQRSEAQNILPVPGKKTDHQGIVISPTPHQITLRQRQSSRHYTRLRIERQAKEICQ